MTAAKPKILLLVDKRDWAYDYSAHALQDILRDEFDFKIFYVSENPLEEARAFDCDLIHVFWWGENWHHALNLPRARVLKEVSSFRWREEAQFGYLSPQAFVDRYLHDAGTIIATSLKMQTVISPHRQIFYTPNGIDTLRFYPEGQREGPMRVGWAGNINDACKGIRDIIMPACENDYELLIAPGNVKSRDEMRRFYNKIDVYCVASTAEGEPLPPMEALACGAFVIAVDVGIMPEIIQHRENGLLVGRSVAAFRAALSWCNANITTLRQQAPTRATAIHASRNWQTLAPYWRAAYQNALKNAKDTQQ